MSLISRQKQTNVLDLKGLSIKSSWILSKDLRLDADYYAKEKELALRILNNKKFTIKPLNSLLVSPMYNGVRFRRIYTKDSDKGIPYLSATETLTFRPKSDKYLSISKTKNLEELLVKKGWLLLTCSGVVGRVTIVNERLSKFVLTHDLIRISPDESKIKSGYLHAFLSTWMAQSLLTTDQYGLAIYHIEPFQIDNLPIPLLDDEVINLIDEQIKKSYSLRDQANEKLDEVESLFYEITNLPTKIENPLEQKKSFTINHYNLNVRLDASFHNPLLYETIRLLKSRKLKLIPMKVLGKVVVAPRFKRIYVKEEYGVPFLQGSDIPMIRPFNLKYLSRKMTANLKKWIIHAGWVLVTCSGTIGRIGLVTKITDGWAASQHLLRIIPYEDNSIEAGYQIDDGYIATFLDTPYGYNQLIAKTYGGVVDEINEDDVGNVLVVIPKDPLIHNKITKLTREAYFLKDLAFLIEQETINLLENLLEGPIKYENIQKLKQSLVETIELRADSILTNEIYDSMLDINEGNTVSLSELKSKYGL